MPQRPSTKPRKKPTQERSKATVDALVDATARILVTEGAEAATTNRIAEVAGVAVGSLYQYFPSREALIAAVVEARLADDTDEAAAAVRAALVDTDPPQALLSWLLNRQRDGALLLAQVLPLLERLERETLARRMVESTAEFLHAGLQARPELLRPDLRDPEALEVALYVVSRALRWVTNEAIVERPELLDDPRFAQELERLVRGLFTSRR